MDNFQRGDRAEQAMVAYQQAGGFTTAEGMIGVATPVFEHGYPFGDLIADLCHLMKRHDVNPMDMVGTGIEHWGADIVEQAWENSDDWDNCLQDESNAERAIEVLNVNGVPEQYHEAVLVKVGIIGPDDPRHPINKD